MKESSKKGKMLRLLPAMVVTLALVISQVSCIQKSANDEGQDIENQQNEVTQNDNLPQNAVYVVDGKVTDGEAVKNLDTKTFGIINIYKEPTPQDIEKYGEKAKNGLIFITTKRETVQTKKETNMASDENLETMAKFIGGDLALTEYLRSNINIPKEAKGADVNITTAYSFVVEKDGTVTNFEWQSTHIEKDRNNPKVIEAAKLCKAEAERVITSTSGKWEPAVNKQGEIVRSRMVMPVIFSVH
jgi:hypothetical protein